MSRFQNNDIRLLVTHALIELNCTPEKFCGCDSVNMLMMKKLSPATQKDVSRAEWRKDVKESVCTTCERVCERV